MEATPAAMAWTTRLENRRTVVVISGDWIAHQAQEFLFAHSFIYGHFRPRRHRMAASSYRPARATAFNVWQQETCLHKVA